MILSLPSNATSQLVFKEFLTSFFYLSTSAIQGACAEGMSSIRGNQTDQKVSHCLTVDCTRSFGLSNLPSKRKEFILDQMFLHIVEINYLFICVILFTFFNHKLQKSCARTNHFSNGLAFLPHTSTAAGQFHNTWVHLLFHKQGMQLCQESSFSQYILKWAASLCKPSTNNALQFPTLEGSIRLSRLASHIQSLSFPPQYTQISPFLNGMLT